ncbi:MAG: hypothetical protein NTX95_00840 [Actinobacteria bacterium]|nr:hypothetical protein [Actinomycetota bacterium]
MIRARRAVTVVLALVAVLACAGVAQAANYPVANADSGQGSDATCNPCRTVMGALRFAMRNAGDDRVLLGTGTYRGNLVIRDANRVSIAGAGARTVIAGNVDIGTPNRDDLYVPDSSRGWGRSVTFTGLVVSSPGEAISAERVDVAITDASVVGTVNVLSAALDAYRATITANGCSPGIVLDVGDIGDAAHSLEQGLDVASNVVQTSVRGAPVITYRGSRNVFDLLLVNQSLLNGSVAGCPPLIHHALSVGADGFAQIANTLILSPNVAGGAGINVTDSLVYATLSTISGAYDVGISSVRSRVISQGMVIDGPPIAVDATGGGNRAVGAFELDYTFASGVARLGGGAVAGPSNRFSTQLGIPAAYPFDVVQEMLLRLAFNGVERPQPFIIGGPELYDAGAIEQPASSLAIVVPPVPGPVWVPGRVLGGVPQVDVDGIGLPAAPGAPVAGSAAAPGGDAAGGAAAVSGPALIIQPPKRVRQGTTVIVRVKVPYRGRLTLRTYGERGGLVAVGKGRPVVKGWRKVKLTIGPNTRLGTLRIVATHVRPQTRAVLTAANVTRVVKG